MGLESHKVVEGSKLKYGNYGTLQIPGRKYKISKIYLDIWIDIEYLS